LFLPMWLYISTANITNSSWKRMNKNIIMSECVRACVSEWVSEWVREWVSEWHLVGFYNTNSLKQKSANRHVARLGHAILIPNQSVFTLSPSATGLTESNKYQFDSLWLDPIGVRTYDLRGEHANYYTTEYDKTCVKYSLSFSKINIDNMNSLMLCTFTMTALSRTCGGRIKRP
jgi:hypothetical protein